MSQVLNKDQGAVDLDIGEAKYTVVDPATITSQRGLAKESQEEKERPRFNKNNGPSAGEVPTRKINPGTM